MNIRRNILLGAIIGAITITHINTSYAWKEVYDPTNHAENVVTKLQMIEQVRQQAEQIKHELANLAKLSPNEVSTSVNEIQSLISEMNTIRNQTNAIGTDFRTVMEQFDELRPDYADWNGVSAEDYAKQADKVRTAWEASVEQSMKSQGIASPDEQQKTADSLSRLLNASQNAEGAMGALQAANQISSLQILELQKMQAIMADSMRTQNMYFQKEIDAEKRAKKIKEDSFGKTEFQDYKFEATGEKLDKLDE